MCPENRQFYLGTSGWAHRDWIGRLYPHDTPPAEYLATYAQHFHTVEIEHTFFETPTREMVQAWYRRTPAGFIFCPCAPRQITHVQRLHHTQGMWQEFLDIISGLKEKLGPILVQLPDDFRPQELRSLETFLQTLPRAQQLAIEFHHGSWLKDATYALLETYQVAWVIVEAPFLPRTPRVTANFAYVRWHGYPGISQQSRRQIDPVAAWQPWIPILRDLARQVPNVYGYVRNRFSGYAPRDCQTLQKLLGAE
jgi:uncharacterized protein YecE (DUF72 family)